MNTELQSFFLYTGMVFWGIFILMVVVMAATIFSMRGKEWP